jgi:hypothetical protein
MTMAIEATMVDWSNIQTAMDALKTSPDEQINLMTLIDHYCDQFIDLIEDDWNVQEVNIADNGRFTGVPIQLAFIVLNVFKFAANENIDLVDAMEKAAKYV